MVPGDNRGSRPARPATTVARKPVSRGGALDGQAHPNRAPVAPAPHRARRRSALPGSWLVARSGHNHFWSLKITNITSALPSMSASAYAYPSCQLSSGIRWKFIP